MRNIDYAIKRVAIEKEIDEEIVKTVITHYWKEVISKVNSFEHEAIHIRHVGTFYVQYNKLKKALENTIRAYRNNRKDYHLDTIKKFLSIRERTSKKYYSLWKSRK